MPYVVRAVTSRKRIGCSPSATRANWLQQELHDAQRDLGEITGEVTSDDLLGRIFGSFCIGK